MSDYRETLEHLLEVDATFDDGSTAKPLHPDEAQAIREALADVERLRAERGEFSDVLHRATLAEAEVERLSKALDENWRKEQQGHADPCTYGALCPWCEVERLKADHEACRKADKAVCEEYRDRWQRAEAKIEAALALIDKRLERTRSWSDVRTHDERNALRSIREALKGEEETDGKA